MSPTDKSQHAEEDLSVYDGDGGDYFTLNHDLVPGEWVLEEGRLWQVKTDDIKHAFLKTARFLVSRYLIDEPPPQNFPLRVYYALQFSYADQKERIDTCHGVIPNRTDWRKAAGQSIREYFDSLTGDESSKKYRAVTDVLERFDSGSEYEALKDFRRHLRAWGMWQPASFGPEKKALKVPGWAFKALMS